MANKAEMFILLSGLQKHIDRGQWDDVAEIVNDTLWEVASSEWKAKQKTKNKSQKDKK
jgi:hypothetical protein